MMTIRRGNERGHANHGWLDTQHTFSFADYYDPKNMGFRALRVINEDRVSPGMGFGTHGHRDMEIISVVLEGALAHKDSMGSSSVLKPGEVQRMSAGTGVMHSEFNGSKTEPVHFLQIWLLPNKTGVAPSYEQKTFTTEQKQNQLRLIAAPGGQGGALDIAADAKVYATVLSAGQTVKAATEGAHAWVHVATASLEVNGQRLEAGDGAALSHEALTLTGVAGGGEAIVFELQ